ncbi:MAG: 50S ribosomal protein L23 [Gemmatimonadetes bacterium]|nr:MAG: 50S ribosomal protein L23 [Gemmatimonadota bacterium]
MKSIYQIIKRPIITEKSTILRETGHQYTFAVDPRANKIQIKQAIEQIFDVHVTDVRTAKVHGKPRQQRPYRAGHAPDWKKAVVTLHPESKPIDIFEEVG